jgi:hypothetical protein
MSTTKIKAVKADGEPKERNWAIPDQVVSLEEIQTSIKSAEKGPFMTVAEAINDFEQWLKSRHQVRGMRFYFPGLSIKVYFAAALTAPSENASL